MKRESDILLEILGDKLVSLNATFLGQTAADPYINISAFPLVYEAMQLYSDQQNKELRERLAQEDEKDVFIERANAEIQRLTKEVEEFRKSDREHIYYADKLEREITRLRELLVRSNDLISDYEHRFSEFDPNKRDLLVRDIDNALNHKP